MISDLPVQKAPLEIFTSCFVPTGYNVADPQRKKFIPWQTWDLIRITWYGYRGFCKDFVQRHPGYAVYPLRLTGSAVETIFSRLKFITVVTYQPSTTLLLGLTCSPAMISMDDTQQTHTGMLLCM